ncbi:MAG: heavy metal translocating P-type ATPase [Inquilinaceae bacterium]
MTRLSAVVGDAVTEASFGTPCCSAAATAAAASQRADPVEDRPTDVNPVAAGDHAAFVRTDPEGVHALDLMVEGLHCGACVQKIERALRARTETVSARVNLSTRRLALRWRGEERAVTDLLGSVSALGYGLVPFDPQRLQSSHQAEERVLLRSMAVAGFAAANVMLLSVSIWAGHAQDMGAATRDLFHWISALIALPAILYAGQPFFRSAARALRHRTTNMDVPISLGVVLAAGMSLSETIQGGQHAYFDSAIMLLFFLLVGRYLDGRARGQARSTAERLLTLQATAVTLVMPDGRQVRRAPSEIRPGSTVLVAAGERIGIDGTIAAGRSDIDTSLITGETAPVAVAPGDAVFAGTVNHTGPLRVTATAVGEGTVLGEIVRLMSVAEQRKARFVGLADRIARLYAPVVHGLALATFLGWVLFAGMPWQEALLIAVAVLIITCPCALGLAVPAVQVIASGRLMRQGIVLKSATALERLAAADTVVFDKTGTLTTGRLTLDPDPARPAEALETAARLARTSRHPLARALSRAAPPGPAADGVREEPGQGLSLVTDEGEIRLGSRAWCGVTDAEAADDAAPGPELWLRRPGQAAVRFAFADTLRADAVEIVAKLRRRGYRIVLLSGDRPAAVAPVANALGITDWKAGCTPADKCARLAALAEDGRSVLMVGDGLNDAPALTAAAVSLSPSTAADISQTAADAVFQGERLAPVAEILHVARRAQALVGQNFRLAFGYNVLAIPVAVAGLVTPLIAALAMSGSSLIVVGNALRLAGGRRR